METENKLARSYVDYLLGRVICCDTAEQVRCYKTAITAEGMLYQGYVARALRKGWMEDAFIGRRAVQLRIDHLEKELACLQEERRHWQPLQKQLTGRQEPLFTQRFVRIDVAQKQEDYQRVQTITKEIAEVKMCIRDSLRTLLEEAGIAPGRRIGIAGWKHFTSPVEKNEKLFDIPAFILDAILSLIHI